GRLLPGTAIGLESAEWRLFAGVRLRHLTLARQDDPDAPPFAVLPEVICYPDKQQLSRGRLIVRKIEIDRPRLLLSRHSNGKWNLTGLMTIPTGAGSRPICEIRQATLVIADQVSGASPLQLTDLDFAILPQSGSAVQVRLTGHSDLTGAFSLDGAFN